MYEGSAASTGTTDTVRNTPMIDNTKTTARTTTASNLADRIVPTKLPNETVPYGGYIILAVFLFRRKIASATTTNTGFVAQFR